jgi:Ceramidase
VAKYTMLAWTLAALVWVSDRFFCNLWLRVGIPGGHWLWHPLSAVAGYRAIVFFIYRNAVTEYPHAKPTFSYWPAGWRNLGLLYVGVDEGLPQPNAKYGENNNEARRGGGGGGGTAMNRRGGKKRF